MVLFFWLVDADWGGDRRRWTRGGTGGCEPLNAWAADGWGAAVRDSLVKMKEMYVMAVDVKCMSDVRV